MLSLEYLNSCGFNIEDYIKEFVKTIGTQDSKELTITPNNGDYLVCIADGKTTYKFSLYSVICETESGKKEWFDTAWQKYLFAKINRSFINNATKFKQNYISGLLDHLLAEFNNLSLEETVIKVSTTNKRIILKNMNIVFKPLFVSIMERINEIEYSLKAKGYQ